MPLLIADTFTTSLAKLTGDEQKPSGTSTWRCRSQQRPNATIVSSRR